ncbi:MAG: glycosyltransferase [Chloroflexi bacterium]|nr:glycosyltransferase [Chloroflexota bacterium]
MLLTLLRLLYFACVALLMLYALGAGALLIAYFLRRPDKPSPSPERSTDRAGAASPSAGLPSVCVQLPVFNEPFVIDRLIDAAARLDYPPDRLTIQVLDDSQDDTTERAAERVATWAAHGIRIEHIRRADRSGFKAGALAHGAAISDAEFFAVFDADFVPPPDFLRRIVPF